MTDEVDQVFRRLLFDVRRSVRYHRRRQQFLDRVADWIRVTTAIAGSGTVAVFLAEQREAALAAAVLTAVLSASDVVFTPGRLARRHHEFAQQFLTLEQDMLLMGNKRPPSRLPAFQARRLKIESDEPPHYRVLNAMCHDEVVTALGYPDEMRTNITSFQRL